MEGPVGPQAQMAELGPKACFREELERGAAPHLINWCGSLSTSEVGLNIWRGAAQGLWSRLVAPTGTKGGLWSRLVAPTGTKGYLWSRLLL